MTADRDALRVAMQDNDRRARAMVEMAAEIKALRERVAEMEAEPHERAKYPLAMDRIVSSAEPRVIEAARAVRSSGANSYRSGERNDDVVIARSAYERVIAALDAEPGHGG